MSLEDIELIVKSMLEKMVEGQKKLDQIACQALAFPNVPDELREAIYCILYIGEQIRIIHKTKSVKEIEEFKKQNPEMQRKLDRLVEIYGDLPEIKS